jgi:hypothetical protein
VKCSLKFRPESIQNPSHLVAPLLYGISFPLPTLIFIFACLLSFFLVKRIASVLAASNSTAFCCAHSMAIFPHSSSISVISLMLLPDAIQDMSSTKDNPVAPVFCSTWSNTPEMYIANRIGDTGEPCGIPVFVGFMPVSWPLMTREAFRYLCKKTFRMRDIMLIKGSLSSIKALPPGSRFPCCNRPLLQAFLWQCSRNTQSTVLYNKTDRVTRAYRASTLLLAAKTNSMQPARSVA